MTEEEVRRALECLWRVITDDEGHVIGSVHAAARFKIHRDYLARGGFLEVVRDEETGDLIAHEYDALPHPRRRGVLYPGGYCLKEVWRVPTLEEAVERVMRYFTPGAPDPWEGPPETPPRRR